MNLSKFQQTLLFEDRQNKVHQSTATKTQGNLYNWALLTGLNKTSLLAFQPEGLGGASRELLLTIMHIIK